MAKKISKAYSDYINSQGAGGAIWADDDKKKAAPKKAPAKKGGSGGKKK